MRDARQLALLLLLPLAAAQNPDPVKFEVASVKLISDPDARPFIRGGPGTSDPEQISYEAQTLSRLLCRIYALEFDQISGPSWLTTERYTIAAKLPPGTTKEQFQLMWKDLLAERFHLRTHTIRKEFPAYELSVSKSGWKPKNEPGFREPPPRQTSAITPAPRDIRLTFRNASMADLAQRLGWPLSTMPNLNELAMGRVIDKTGLTGHYDFTLEFAGRWGPEGAVLPPPPDGHIDNVPDLFNTLRQQLGLRLDEKKVWLDVLVVDHADRIPTEN